MKLPLKDAERCIELLDKLDIFALETYDTFQKYKGKVVHDFNQFRKEIRDVREKDDHFIDNFLLHHPLLPEEDKKLIESWKNSVSDMFYILEYKKKHALFFSPEKKRLYGVLALTDSFEVMVPYNVHSIIVETTLLPYNDHIVWDGLVAIREIPLDMQVIKFCLLAACRPFSVTTQL